MDNNQSQTQLNGTATIDHIQRDNHSELQSFDIVVPPSKVQPEGSTIHFDLSHYSRPNESDASNKALRETILKNSQFLAENVPAFTPLVASIAESGARKFSLQNPDAGRFGIATFPGITNNEARNENKPVVLVGNLDKLTDFSQIGYEGKPKAYLDNNYAQHDLRPQVILLEQLAMASKDTQNWPLPLLYEGGEFKPNQTIHNVMHASIFVRDAIKFTEDDVPALDNLKQGLIPHQLLNKGYPEPTLVTPNIKQNLHKPTEIDEVARLEVTGYNTIRDRIAENLAQHVAHLDIDTQKTDELTT